MSYDTIRAMNHSPWIVQLKRARPAQVLDHNLTTDVVVVGGGIAGITTAFFLLSQTDHRVVLIDAGNIAHGATGHNAGQITSYFEKTFAELAERYGVVRTAHAHKVIEEDARSLLEGIFSYTQLTTPYSQFVGYDGLSRRDQVDLYLEDMYLKSKAGLRVRPMLIAREWQEHSTIDAKYIPYIQLVPQKDILSLLETFDTQYIAGYPFLSGCMNSALFCEEMVGYLLANFANRFVLREQTRVDTVNLYQDQVILSIGSHTITANYAVLCTNGFESINIINNSGADINEHFHHEVNGIIGYMGAYKEPLSKPPYASIYSHQQVSQGNPYFYVTRRPFEDESNAKHNLICIGGPEVALPDRAQYHPHHEYPLTVADIVDTFAAQNFHRHPPQMDYYWHGLMGYTKSWVRLIGHEPKNRRLLYNLGCNGVGILTSIYGSHRIARLLRGDIVEHTIFDPQ